VYSTDLGNSFLLLYCISRRFSCSLITDTCLILTKDICSAYIALKTCPCASLWPGRNLGKWTQRPGNPYLGAWYMWVISFTLRPLYLWYPLFDRRLGGPLISSDRRYCPFRKSNPGRISPIHWILLLPTLGWSMALQNDGNLPYHYMTSQPRRPWRWRQHGPPKRWYPTTTFHGVTTQKTSTWTTWHCRSVHLDIFNFLRSTVSTWRSDTMLIECTKVYPKVSGLAAWSENCKWYNSLPLGAVVSLFYESV
jgi:hypothetical protein